MKEKRWLGLIVQAFDLVYIDGAHLLIIQVGVLDSYDFHFLLCQGTAFAGIIVMYSPAVCILTDIIHGSIVLMGCKRL